MAHYFAVEKDGHWTWEKVSDGYKDHNAGLNGPIYCPEGGYYDPILNKRFESKREKREFMKANGLIMEGGKGPKKLEGQGIKTYYSYPGQKTMNRGYKYR